MLIKLLLIIKLNCLIIIAGVHVGVFKPAIMALKKLPTYEMIGEGEGVV